MSSFKGMDRKTLRKKRFPQPIFLSDELVESMTLEQKHVLIGLLDLRDESEKLTKKINYCRPTGVTLCEDEDDLKAITIAMPERGALKKVQVRIQLKLSEALDLGLGSLGLIRNLCADYGVKP